MPKQSSGRSAQHATRIASGAMPAITARRPKKRKGAAYPARTYASGDGRVRPHSQVTAARLSSSNAAHVPEKADMYSPMSPAPQLRKRCA